VTPVPGTGVTANVAAVLAIYLNENQTLVRTLNLIHILAAILAFGPTFFYHRLRRNGELVTVATLHTRLVMPALVVLWVAGMGIAGINKISLASTYWITISIVLWIVALAVSWFLIRPAMTDTSEAATKKLSAGVGITHLILVVSLWLMIFKPFVDGIYVFND
jgi:hypothetical protein